MIEKKKKKKRSPVECAVLKESETRYELNALKRKIFEIETIEAKRFCEIEDADAATNEDLITVQKKDQNRNSAKKQSETSPPPQFKFAQPRSMITPRSQFTPFFGFNRRRPYRPYIPNHPFRKGAYPLRAHYKSYQR